MNYYNDNDQKACAWLRELIAAGELPPGDVDERSITEIKADDLAGYDQCHFFAGIGGWALALRWAGLEGVPGIWTGSCPCQPLSCAGKRQGHADERHLWPAFHDLIAECRPATVFGEQVASKDGREWFAGVRLDLEGLGYACGGADLCAAGVGAPHRRQRLYWVAAGLGAGLEGHAGNERDGREPGRDGAEAARHAAACGATGELADAEHDGGRSDEPGREAQGRAADGRACGVGDATGDGRQVWERVHGELRGQGLGEGCESVRLGNAAGRGCGVGGDAPLAGRGGHPERPGWSGCVTIQCRDGKARRIPAEPALFPLAHGIPGRVGLLRGAGNAIVPEVAEAFVRAWAETQKPGGQSRREAAYSAPLGSPLKSGGAK